MGATGVQNPAWLLWNRLSAIGATALATHLSARWLAKELSIHRSLYTQQGNRCVVAWVRSLPSDGGRPLASRVLRDRSAGSSDRKGRRHKEPRVRPASGDARGMAAKRSVRHREPL